MLRVFNTLTPPLASLVVALLIVMVLVPDADARGRRKKRHDSGGNTATAQASDCSQATVPSPAAAGLVAGQEVFIRSPSGGFTSIGKLGPDGMVRLDDQPVKMAKPKPMPPPADSVEPEKKAPKPLPSPEPVPPPKRGE
jgi:outer membrane biosynthesis protein TonB